jgi:hypothetical protein
VNYINKAGTLRRKSHVTQSKTLCDFANLTTPRRGGILEVILKSVTEITIVNHFDSSNNISLQFGHRGKVAIFIDGNNLFHAARFHNIDIDYNKLLRVLLGDGRLFRAFFYTGVDAGAERQQGFLLWMRAMVFASCRKS